MQALGIEVSIADQSLWVRDRSGQVIRHFQVSTAKNGPGQLQDSGCTPLGQHYIRAHIGADLPTGAVLVGRRWTGEIYNQALSEQYPDRDWILSRILWLCGCQLGHNRGGSCDSMRRYIYIHGTPDTEPMGQPLSAGCIRMRNEDVIELFDMAPKYTPVTIKLK